MQRNSLYGDPARLWRAVVSAQPDNVEAWLYLAEAQKRQGDPGAAGEAYARLVELAPRFAQGLNAYAEFLHDNNEPDKAVHYARRALHTQEGVVLLPARLTLARALVRTGSAREALNELHLTQGRFNGYGAYWETRGRALAMLGDHLGALDSFQQEQAVYFPATSDVLLRQGEQLLALRQYAAAEPRFRYEVERTDAASAWNGLGAAQALQGRYGEAVDAFRKAMERSPENRNYRLNFEEALVKSRAIR